ncbi:hypothetical protein KL86PLE_60395 [uncultured Pleomorphomonas sp.]|uniref:Uncharacterized protein n=1 Tax=uncultured Pleomorphomonas sp. TaxID=442121 RepID=A0A212LKL5_9HYPH|nr:hypothetical protein KL86PLE_60395 [uncultured Pleomorphomonas sp.]
MEERPRPRLKGATLAKTNSGGLGGWIEPEPVRSVIAGGRRHPAGFPWHRQGGNGAKL